MLNAACLYPYGWRKKKNDQPYIIPPSYFKEKGIKPVKISSEVKENALEKAEAVKKQEIVSNPIEDKEGTPAPLQHTETVEKQNPTPISVEAPNSTSTSVIEEKKNLLIQRERKTSGLSLSSIRKKKEHEESKEEKIVDPKNLPTEEFTESEMQAAWVEYGKMQDKKGERIIGSMFAMNIPSLQDGAIMLELPNQSMKVDLESAQSGLLQFLYKKLDNYSIELKITVNEEASKKYAFTPQDKYEKLREKNPLIDKLRSSFDLDI